MPSHFAIRPNIILVQGKCIAVCKHWECADTAHKARVSNDFQRDAAAYIVSVSSEVFRPLKNVIKKVWRAKRWPFKHKRSYGRAAEKRKVAAQAVAKTGKVGKGIAKGKRRGQSGTVCGARSTREVHFHDFSLPFPYREEVVLPLLVEILRSDFVSPQYFVKEEKSTPTSSSLYRMSGNAVLAEWYPRSEKAAAGFPGKWRCAVLWGSAFPVSGNSAGSPHRWRRRRLFPGESRTPGWWSLRTAGDVNTTGLSTHSFAAACANAE